MVSSTRHLYIVTFLTTYSLAVWQMLSSYLLSVSPQRVLDDIWELGTIVTHVDQTPADEETNPLLHSLQHVNQTATKKSFVTATVTSLLMDHPAKVNTTNLEYNNMSYHQPLVNKNPTKMHLEGQETFNCSSFIQQRNASRVLHNSPDLSHEETHILLLEANGIEGIDSILGNTFCHEQGRFRTTSATAGRWNSSDIDLLKDWEFKLTYLAIHDFHHRPAREELIQHRSCAAKKEEVEKFDFSCSHAKFMVSTIPDMGLGAAVRLAATQTMLMAIASDRVPIFVGNTPEGPAFLRKPWSLASCPRQDMQCVLRPTTPCTLSLDDLTNITVMPETEVRGLRTMGKMPDQYKNERVIAVESRIVPAKFDQRNQVSSKIARKLYDRAQLLIQEYDKTASASNKKDEEFMNMLQEAAKRILLPIETTPLDKYHYGHRGYRPAHAALLYLLRPNEAAKDYMRARVKEVVPNNLNALETLGMPIRGSDKCHSESTCLTFDQYMQLAAETWNDSPRQAKGNQRGKLVLTTEDAGIFQKRVHYNESTNFPLDFVVNDQDSFQGSGDHSAFVGKGDHILMSSLIAMQLQSNAGTVFGNCCSNFHVMLFDFLKEGCGVTTQTTCLQETTNYNVCCAWTSGAECQAIREEYKKTKQLEAKKEKNNLSL